SLCMVVVGARSLAAAKTSHSPVSEQPPPNGKEKPSIRL
ncbi:MAG: hypothetical protein ACI8VI_000945, partial [Granulosicoccus sp.]